MSGLWSFGTTAADDTRIRAVVEGALAPEGPLRERLQHEVERARPVDVGEPDVADGVAALTGKLRAIFLDDASGSEDGEAAGAADDGGVDSPVARMRALLYGGDGAEDEADEDDERSPVDAFRSLLKAAEPEPAALDDAGAVMAQLHAAVDGACPLDRCTDPDHALRLPAAGGAELYDPRVYPALFQMQVAAEADAPRGAAPAPVLPDAYDVSALTRARRRSAPVPKALPAPPPAEVVLADLAESPRNGRGTPPATIAAAADELLGGVHRALFRDELEEEWHGARTATARRPPRPLPLDYTSPPTVCDAPLSVQPTCHPHTLHLDPTAGAGCAPEGKGRRAPLRTLPPNQPPAVARSLDFGMAAPSPFDLDTPSSPAALGAAAPPPPAASPPAAGVLRDGSGQTSRGILSRGGTAVRKSVAFNTAAVDVRMLTPSDSAESPLGASTASIGLDQIMSSPTSLNAEDPPSLPDWVPPAGAPVHRLRDSLHWGRAAVDLTPITTGRLAIERERADLLARQRALACTLEDADTPQSHGTEHSGLTPITAARLSIEEEKAALLARHAALARALADAPTPSSVAETPAPELTPLTAARVSIEEEKAMLRERQRVLESALAAAAPSEGTGTPGTVVSDATPSAAGWEPTDKHPAAVCHEQAILAATTESRLDSGRGVGVHAPDPTPITAKRASIEEEKAALARALTGAPTPSSVAETPAPELTPLTAARVSIEEEKAMLRERQAALAEALDGVGVRTPSAPGEPAAAAGTPSPCGVLAAAESPQRGVLRRKGPQQRLSEGLADTGTPCRGRITRARRKPQATPTTGSTSGGGTSTPASASTWSMSSSAASSSASSCFAAMQQRRREERAAARAALQQRAAAALQERLAEEQARAAEQARQQSDSHRAALNAQRELYRRQQVLSAEREQAREVRKRRLRALAARASAHYSKRLLRTHGFAPWRRYCEARQAAGRAAAAHSDAVLVRRAFSGLRDGTAQWRQVRSVVRVFRAIALQRLLRQCLARGMLRRWRGVVAARRLQEVHAARCHRGSCLTAIWQHWRAAFTRRAAARDLHDARLADALRAQLQRRRLHHCLNTWQVALEERQLAAQRRRFRQRMMLAAREVLGAEPAAV
eukprot:TRINITY_DN3203_c0_g1_i2.p1 TRINITY_DN3203_c0_g1~~TRINITY_DN3203_c0_g1_i2.p1  ORF type:complete len:1125 (+),score=259.71 TRINITY_DN3203_c0_g1_i2:45-3419(+)